MKSPRYHESVGALVVYDVTSRESFENAARWLGEVRDHAEPDTVAMLVGNKTDLKNRRVVKTEEGRKFARKFHFLMPLFQNLTSRKVKTRRCLLKLLLLTRAKLILHFRNF